MEAKEKEAKEAKGAKGGEKGEDVHLWVGSQVSCARSHNAKSRKSGSQVTARAQETEYVA